jgi:hypothetical protein
MSGKVRGTKPTVNEDNFGRLDERLELFLRLNIQDFGHFGALKASSCASGTAQLRSEMLRVLGEVCRVVRGAR